MRRRWAVDVSSSSVVSLGVEFYFFWQVRPTLCALSWGMNLRIRSCSRRSDRARWHMGALHLPHTTHDIGFLVIAVVEHASETTSVHMED